MPKRKSPEGSEGKESSKVTKQEPTRRSERLSAKPVPPKAEVKPKKAIVKKVAEEKGAKAKKGSAKGKKEDGHTQNGETKNNEIYVSRPSVSVSSVRSTAPSLMSVRGQSDTVRVKDNWLHQWPARENRQEGSTRGRSCKLTCTITRF
uniref:high mobility group nucleosome-binding domain-containing protein 3 isoform X1 n=1 Tax=Solea senegalensis TaxID=28829 RepID=UPI001CD84440|nr:high mobility group nucleosome-binding domain-containing protein 3 isoform X1 [Solea senegalensis]